MSIGKGVANKFNQAPQQVKRGREEGGASSRELMK
jgi:hypothetical protein